MFYVLGNVTFSWPQNVIQPQNVKQCYVLRDPHLRFGYYAIEIIITFCVNLIRFALCFYVLGNVMFCGPTKATEQFNNDLAICRPLVCIQRVCCEAATKTLTVFAVSVLLFLKTPIACYFRFFCNKNVRRVFIRVLWTGNVTLICI